MERAKYRYEEAKIIFLRDAVRGTEWLFRAAVRVTDLNSFQIHITSMNKPLRDLYLFRVANTQEGKHEVKQEYIRKKLWKYQGREEKNVNDTLYTGQGRYGRNPRHIYRSAKQCRSATCQHHPKKFSASCFNCGNNKCSIATYDNPKDQDLIAKNLSAWKKERGFKLHRPLRIILAELSTLHRDYAAKIMFT